MAMHGDPPPCPECGKCHFFGFPAPSPRPLSPEEAAREFFGCLDHPVLSRSHGIRCIEFRAVFGWDGCKTWRTLLSREAAARGVSLGMTLPRGSIQGDPGRLASRNWTEPARRRYTMHPAAATLYGRLCGFDMHRTVPEGSDTTWTRTEGPATSMFDCVEGVRTVIIHEATRCSRGEMGKARVDRGG